MNKETSKTKGKLMKNPQQFFKDFDDYCFWKNPINGGLYSKEDYEEYLLRLNYEEQHEAEQYAENAWLRHAEQASYDDMAFEKYEWERGAYL